MTNTVYNIQVYIYKSNYLHFKPASEETVLACVGVSVRAFVSFSEEPNSLTFSLVLLGLRLYSENWFTTVQIVIIVPNQIIMRAGYFYIFL